MMMSILRGSRRSGCDLRGCLHKSELLRHLEILLYSASQVSVSFRKPAQSRIARFSGINMSDIEETTTVVGLGFGNTTSAISYTNRVWFRHMIGKSR